jgi:transcriptional regulator of acetoin/glycerol metabolism
MPYDLIPQNAGTYPVERIEKSNNLNLEEVEKQLINKALQQHNGNISQASKELGLTRAALYRRMEKYGI